MEEFYLPILDFCKSTQIPAQIENVDVKGLFSNLYFMLPFLAIVGHTIYQKDYSSLTIGGLAIGIWILTGSEYMQSSSADGTIGMDKLLPILLGGIVIMAIIVYIYFIRSD
jgi:hypothetical protein